MRNLRKTRLRRAAAASRMACAVICFLASAASAQIEDLQVHTESPRATLDSFLRLRERGEVAIRQFWMHQNRATTITC
jgi:hypothetical protein